MLPCTAEIKHCPEPALGASPGFTAQYRELLIEPLHVWLFVALLSQQFLTAEAGKSGKQLHGQGEDNGAISL